MLPHRTFLAVVLVSALLTAGCGELFANYNDLRIVQSELVKKFGEDVEVNAMPGKQGGTFMAWFVNSAVNDSSAEQRQIRAAEAAKVIAGTYPQIQKVAEVWVIFLRKKSRFDSYDKSQIVTVHGFDKHAQPLPERRNDNAPSAAATGIAVTPTYSSTSDETDISVSGIQLEGTPGGLGVTVLPFFKVSGSVKDGKRPAPKTVTLNFASYAEKPKFKETVPITFVADGKVGLKTKGNFKGKDAQFCDLIIPYSDFRRLVSGKELKIKLGDKEYPLTPSQLAAMHSMTEYVQE